jgi:integrase/recombinase XerC
MIDTFLKFIQFEKRYSPKTVQSYQTDLTQFQKYLESEFSGTAIQEVNYSLVRSWVVSLVEAKLDSRSINRKIACLRSYYKFLMRQEIISADPMVKNQDS